MSINLNQDKEIKIWLDDEADDPGKDYRKTPEGFTPVRTPEEFRELVTQASLGIIKITAIDFDNDLGVPGAENEGNGLLKWMMKEHPELFLGPIIVTSHSKNPEEYRKINEEGKKLQDKAYVEQLVEAKSRPDPWANLGEIDREGPKMM
jgi:hypothetical protein